MQGCNNNRKKVFGLVFIQLFSKITGFLREIILMNFFGGSLIFADYLKIMTFGQIVTIFSTEGGLTANLLAKFSKINKEEGSFYKIKKDTVIISFFIFILVTIFQLFAFIYLVKSNYNFYLVIFISSFTSALAFYLNIGQISLLSIGNYLDYNKSNFYRSFVFIIFLYPLLYFFGILGAVINRFVSVFVQYFNTWSVANKKLNFKKTDQGLSKKDFNIWIFLTNNAVMCWYLILRLNASFDTNIDIIFLTYAFVISSAFDGVILKSISLFVLERFVNSEINHFRIIFYVFLFSFLTLSISIYFGEYFFQLFFGFTSKYDLLQINKIFKYFILLLIVIMSSGILNICFQKHYSSVSISKYKYSKSYFIISFFLLMILSVVNLKIKSTYVLLQLFTFFIFIVNLIFIIKIYINDRRNKIII